MKKIMFILILGLLVIGIFGVVSAENDACQQDSDCELVFSSCSCSNVCLNKINETRTDCARACAVEESNESIQSCKCENNKCVKYDTPPDITQCTTNADCPSVSGKQYCKDSYTLCGTVSSYSCIDGKCVASGGGVGCKVCAYGCKDDACIQENEIIKEQVKCVFDGSNQIQKCYTAGDNSRAYCSGVETCIADISGYKGEKITWKSSCGGYAYTTIDGENKYAKFTCNDITTCKSYKCDDGTLAECKIDQNGACLCQTCPPIIVKPVCGNGICEAGEGEVCISIQGYECQEGKECKVPTATCNVVCPQDCKTTEPIYPDLNEKFRLQVYQAAKIRENGEDIIKIIFKDLIAYKCAAGTTTSSVVKEKVAVAEASITGNIIAPVETSTVSASSGSTSGGGRGSSTTPISITKSPVTEVFKCVGAGPKALLDVGLIVNGDLGKHFILNLDIGEKKQFGEFTISFLGYDYASRTGTLLVSRETSSCPIGCKCDIDGTSECPTETCKKGETLCPDGACREKCDIITEDCKYGCLYEGKCFPMGVRSSGRYCGTDLIMTSQLNSDDKCDNNFECQSNVCVSGKCVSEGLINKMINWLKGLFG